MKKLDYDLCPDFTLALLRSQLSLDDQKMLLKKPHFLVEGKSSGKLDHSKHLLAKIKNGKQVLILNQLTSTKFINFVKKLSIAYTKNLSIGDIYLFPSWLNHQVYTFFGAGERRSFSFNIRCYTSAVSK